MGFFKKGEWKLFGKIYSAMFFGIAMPDIDILLMLFFFAKGFSATQVGIGFGLLSLFVIISEVPTGAIADLYGKKVSIQIHWLVHGISTIMFFFVTEPWHMWILFSIWGISQTFASGALDALPVDIASEAKRKDLIKEFYSKMFIVCRLAMSVSYFLSLGFLLLVGSTNTYQFLGERQGLDFLWFTTASGYLVAFFIILRLKEKVKKKAFSLKKSFKETYKQSIEGIKYSKKHPVIRKLFLASFFMVIAQLFFSDIVFQPFLIDIGFKAENIAMLIAFASILGAVFSYIANHMEKRFRTEKHFLQAVILTEILMLILLFFFTGPIFSIVFFFIYYNLKDLRLPLWSSFSQLFYKNELRATIGSVGSIFNHLGNVIFIPLIGFLVDNIGAKSTTVIGILPFFIVFFVLRSIRHEKRIEH